jgi:hypothetical protein
MAAGAFQLVSVAVFGSRTGFGSVGAGGGTLRLVNKRDIQDLAVKGVKEVPVEVPAGTIDCIQLKLKTKPVNEYAREHADEFEGPFGLYGDVELYVEKDTRQVVLVRGQVKLGAVFDIEVALASREAEYLADGPGAP